MIELTITGRWFSRSLCAVPPSSHHPLSSLYARDERPARLIPGRNHPAWPRKSQNPILKHGFESPVTFFPSFTARTGREEAILQSNLDTRTRIVHHLQMLPLFRSSLNGLGTPSRPLCPLVPHATSSQRVIYKIPFALFLAL